MTPAQVDLLVAIGRELLQPDDRSTDELWEDLRSALAAVERERTPGPINDVGVNTSVTVAPLVHGVNCPKASHGAGGFLHLPEDDGPYEVDGVAYCGRCHWYLRGGR